MESIRELESQPPQTPPPIQAASPLDSAYAQKSYSQPFRTQLPVAPVVRTRAVSYVSPLLSSVVDMEQSAGGAEPEERPQSGGTILGIHNLSIVAPQFFVAIIASLIFRLLGHMDPSDSGGGNEDGLAGNDVVWVLRFGGLMSLGGAIASRWVLETQSERTYKKLVLAQLGEE